MEYNAAMKRSKVNINYSRVISRRYTHTHTHTQICDFIYFKREVDGREKERERNIDMQEKHRSSAFNWGPGPQPRHVS